MYATRLPIATPPGRDNRHRYGYIVRRSSNPVIIEAIDVFPFGAHPGCWESSDLHDSMLYCERQAAVTGALRGKLIHPTRQEAVEEAFRAIDDEYRRIIAERDALLDWLVANNI